MMHTLDQAGDLKGKKVLMRADFDVPLLRAYSAEAASAAKAGQGFGGQAVTIAEPFRIVRQKATLDYLVSRGAQVVLAAHISAVPSFESLKPQLEQLLGVSFGDGVTLLENTRQNPGEEANDEAFARELVAGCDIYVNNAFAVCHREHASVVAAATLLPAYAGLLIQEETEQLTKVINAPAQGKVVYIGGAKASTKIPVIEHLIERAEHVAVGGVAANEILAGNTNIDTKNTKLHLPTDFVMDDGIARDIGPESTRTFAELAAGASLIVWNGPMGKFEDARFMAGTEAIARAIAASGALSIIGGGDTISAVDSLGLLDTFTFVSTGGGAMLAFLAGTQLPGLKALGYYKE